MMPGKPRGWIRQLANPRGVGLGLMDFAMYPNIAVFWEDKLWHFGVSCFGRTYIIGLLS